MTVCLFTDFAYVPRWCSLAIVVRPFLCNRGADTDGDITPTEGGLPYGPVEVTIIGGDRDEGYVTIKVFGPFGR
ncbi:MAG TPA: hypothetical protein PKI05_06285 [Thermogutta sp.]|nr:hypothetical protein [Thermogutta sp.]HOP77183.1 hypothetical protein [Thermogutta sp.]HPU05261.1 hypothetical protein [Thermogutta sp.]HPZ82313.1 hypothetical protein [Thermogutta sp.]